MPGRMDWVVQGPDDGLPAGQRRDIFQVFGYGATGDGQTIAVQQILGQQIFHQRWNAAHRMQVFLNECAAGFHIGQQGHPIAGVLKIF